LVSRPRGREWLRDWAVQYRVEVSAHAFTIPENRLPAGVLMRRAIAQLWGDAEMTTIHRIACTCAVFGALCLPFPVHAVTNYFPSTIGPGSIPQGWSGLQDYNNQLQQIANPSKSTVNNTPNPSLNSITFGQQQPASNTNPIVSWASKQLQQLQQLFSPTPSKPANNDPFGLGSANLTPTGAARSSNPTISGTSTTQFQPINSGPPAGWTGGMVCDHSACRLMPVPASPTPSSTTTPKTGGVLQNYTSPTYTGFKPNVPGQTLQDLIQANGTSTTSFGPAPNKYSQVAGVAAVFGVATTSSGNGGTVKFTSNMLQPPAQTMPAGVNISSVGFAPSPSGVATTTPSTINTNRAPGGGTPGTFITPAQLQPSTVNTMPTGAATATGAPFASSSSANGGYTFQQTQSGTVEVRHNGQLIGTGTPSYAAAYGYQPQSGQPSTSASTNTSAAPKLTVVTPASKVITPELRANTAVVHTPTVQTPTVRMPPPTVHVPTPTVHIPTPTIRVPTVTVRVPTVSDARLKRDIVAIGELPDGLHLYRYRYLWSSRLYVGVMAQEVLAVAPDAVVRGNDGYLRVDYGRLGLRLTTWDQWISRRSISNR
jgi:hypothetical protein